MSTLDENTEERKNSFHKSERLHKRKDIQELFQKSSSFFIYPFAVKYFFYPSELKPQLLISVPKKRFKRAVHRNLIKRRIKESYRLNKAHFISELEKNGVSLNFALIYSANEILDYKFIENKLSLVIDRLQSEGQLFFERSANEKAGEGNE